MHNNQYSDKMLQEQLQSKSTIETAINQLEKENLARLDAEAKLEKFM
jgi:hypothetical protein